MLRVNKLTDYATQILCYMAANPAQSASAIGLSEQLNIAQPTVSKVMKYLQKSGLLLSFRGNTGGYKLAKMPCEISLAEVISSIEGGIAMTECSLQSGLCEHEKHCALRSNWQKISRAVLKALEAVSVEDMAGTMPEPLFVLHDWRQSSNSS